MSKLQSYDFDIPYFKGTPNIVADALSHRPHLSLLTDISEDWRHLILAEYAKDAWTAEFIDGTIQDLVNELIIYKGRIFLVLGSIIRRIVLKSFHDSPMAGHPSFYKKYQKIRDHFTWKGLKEEVLQYVRECPIYQQNK